VVGTGKFPGLKLQVPGCHPSSYKLETALYRPKLEALPSFS